MDESKALVKGCPSGYIYHGDESDSEDGWTGYVLTEYDSESDVDNSHTGV